MAVETQQSSISRVEGGTTLPSLSFLLKIAEALNTQLTPPKLMLVERFMNLSTNFENSEKFQVHTYTISTPSDESLSSCTNSSDLKESTKTVSLSY